MTDQRHDEATIRQYLLGRLDAASELAEGLEKRMLADSEFCELADIIEDEIIEDYLEGALDSVEREAVEKHFLRPPIRREKLRTARLLHQHLAAKIPNLTEAAPASILPRSASPWRVWTVLASALLLITSIIYLFTLRHESQSEMAQRSSDLAKERERSAGLAEQLRSLSGLKQPPVAMLTLYQSGTVRSNTQHLPELVLGDATQRIHVEIALLSASRTACDVHLESAAGKPIWAEAKQIPFVSGNTALLIFDMPARHIEPGDYRFVISQLAESSEVSYLFHASRP